MKTFHHPPWLSSLMSLIGTDNSQNSAMKQESKSAKWEAKE